MALHVFATLTNRDNGRTTRLRLRAPTLQGGTWVCNERSRRDAFRRIGADADPLSNPPVSSSIGVRAVDADGWHTYTLWSA